MSALGKGFAIIEAVTAAGPPGLPFMRIVEMTGLPKASAHRLLRELVGLSALQLDPVTRHYRGGMLLARVGAAVMADFDLREAARPHLQALHEETGHVATLGLQHELVGVYLDKIESHGFGIRLHSEIGKPFPLHCTAMGKVMLSQAEPALVERLLAAGLDAYTARTLTDAGQLLRELETVRSSGYAIDREEITRGLVCVAAPVYGIDGEIAGAMSCTFPSYILEERSIDAEIEAVRRHARRASAATGAESLP